MGSEAIGSVTIRADDDTTVAHAHGVKALLESRELVLRGPLRRVLRIDLLEEVLADGDVLRFRADNERYELTLGATVAARWATKILTPPPTLAAKLGISPERPALVIGRVTDAHLAATLAGATTQADSADEVAAVAVAQVDDADAFERALTALPPGLAIWLVYRKGRGVELGDTAIRERMRSRGFVDTKVAAVSDARTATRYSRRS